MISKAEFLERVKKEIISKLDDRKRQKRKKKAIVMAVLFFIGSIILWIVVTGILILTARWVPAPIAAAVLFILPWLPLISVLLCWGYYEDFVYKNIIKVRKKLFQILSMKQDDCVRMEKFRQILKVLPVDAKEAGDDSYIVRDMKSLNNWRPKMQASRLIKEDLIKAKASFQEDTTLSFDNINAAVFDGSLTIHNGSSCPEYRSLLLVIIKTEHFYKEPVVFAKTKGEFFNGRKGLKKVQQLQQNSYFNVFSNDTKAAQNLCLQGLTTKLLRLNDRLFSVNKIEASFFQDSLYIALYKSKNLFQIKRQLKDIHQYEKFYDQIAQLETYCAQFRDL